MHRLWILLGAIAGLGAVAFSALAAHAGPHYLDPTRLAMVDRAVTMQGWHALALLAAGLWAERRGGLLPHLAAAAFVLGVLLFCASVYALALRGWHIGPTAPAGGMLLMLGWLALALSAAWPRRG
jgi:uncharacterized membrane protein YgdD (TMEM256/DUF423 family)